MTRTLCSIYEDNLLVHSFKSTNQPSEILWYVFERRHCNIWRKNNEMEK